MELVMYHFREFLKSEIEELFSCLFYVIHHPLTPTQHQLLAIKLLSKLTSKTEKIITPHTSQSTTQNNIIHSSSTSSSSSLGVGLIVDELGLPVVLMDIYVNYDCSLENGDIYAKIIEAISRTCQVNLNKEGICNL